MKKENYNYFNEFILLTDYIVKSVDILKNVTENFNEKELDASIEEVHRLENEADNVLHKMRNYLIKDFIPPIDREDISLIADKLDNIEDGIDEALINMKIFNITAINKDVTKLVEVLAVSCKAVRETFLDFKNFKNVELIGSKVVEINNLEENGDRIYEEVMTALYKEEKDPINLIRWNNIYNCLENTIDSCEEIGDFVEAVVMKNS